MSDSNSLDLFVLVSLIDFQSTKVILLQHGLLDRNRLYWKVNDIKISTKVAIPVHGLVPLHVSQKFPGAFEFISKDTLNARYPSKGILEHGPKHDRNICARSLAQNIAQALKKIVTESSDKPETSIASEIPHSWERHGDLILFPDKSFKNDFWNKEYIWEEICILFKAKRLARRAEILNNDFRSPQVTLLFGQDPWVNHIDNGITYSWDITKCMFSRGNITEKLRVASFDCRGETVVDLFAGIGYFSLPFLVHAKCDFLHACEWNPDSVSALEVNLKINSVPSNKYKIHFGDNRIVCPQNIADRVNLGLIPSSEISYEIACKALKSNHGGILHIHGNVKSNDRDEWPIVPSFITRKKNAKNKSWDKWAVLTAEKIATCLPSAGFEHYHLQILDVFKIKSYAPKVDHLVMDLKVCLPSR